MNYISRQIEEMNVSMMATRTIRDSLFNMAISKFGTDLIASCGFPECAVSSLIKRRKQLFTPSIQEIHEQNIHSYEFPTEWTTSNIRIGKNIFILTFILK